MQYGEGDTIVAPATPPGVGALAVIRISGRDSVAIADRAFRGKSRPSEVTARTVLHGEILGEGGAPLDEVLLVCFRKPHSYTGEDAVEISCHGAPYLVRRIVECIVEGGARLAGPGEFTRRAFRNGRIDLAQAESVADLIEARTAGAARSALRQLHGELSGRLKRLRAVLLDLVANVEADLDFAAEEAVPSYDRERVFGAVQGTRREIRRLVERGEKGRIVRDGVRVALVGRPNSGKSTLFNALLEEERAIVSPEPGTTRDVLEGEMEIGGILFQLSDTAGMREGAVGPVEGEGIRRAERRRKEADLLLVVLDRSEPLTAEDHGCLAATRGRKRVVVLNKSDLAERVRQLPAEANRAITLSALAGDGLGALREALLHAVAGESGDGAGDPEVTSVRHLGSLRSAERALAAAEGVIDSGELLAEDLRAAVQALGEITGEGARDELLDRIFSRFCIGK